MSKVKHITSRKYFWFFLGVVFLGGYYFSHHYLDKHSPWVELLNIFLSHIGVGLIIMILLGMYLETDHWSHYFEHRLQNIVIKADFLKIINPEKVIELEKNALESLLGDRKIQKSEEFYKFYRGNLQSAISKPYREQLNYNLKITESDNDTFLVDEVISYICRSGGATIQEKTGWKPDKGEFNFPASFDVTLRHSLLHGGEMKFDYNKLSETGYAIGEGNDRGYNIDLKKAGCLHDGLHVSHHIEYKIARYRFVAWRFATLTNGINVQIDYPDKYLLFVQPFLNSEVGIKEASMKEIPFVLESDSWFMEDEGITFQLIQKESD
ncbi:hypothetical protein [Sediminibacterium ginsengisoli]|uniref:Uncharacterized protein n=1 Tax=Sediminibacterium ginsengisoli TaxID=413434 RepID=A0A1T4QGQ2_9BACT|nr:hypothetical protein [Sediminibacterium ginsengisoli]SKA02980.1 hypothetical protein SAMN04488132_108125 [Sediminibacterium ginsengisoli]